MLLQACTSKMDGSTIDYKAINCAGWPEPPKLPNNTSNEAMKKLYPVYVKLQDCMDYRKLQLSSSDKQTKR